jgi:hypothetical protein
MKRNGLFGAKHLPRGDAKEERVANLPGGTGDSDFDRSGHTRFLATGFRQKKPIIWISSSAGFG